MPINSKSEQYKCCFTGYRPSKLPFKIDKNDADYLKFENELIEAILTLAKENCQTFYCGMAMGFDIIAAETVLLIKKITKLPLKLVCVLPFDNQEETFSPFWKDKFRALLDNCDEKIVLSDHYFPGCYQKRNIFMVDNCDYVLTWFDGRSGGTKNTINYAKKKGRYIFNINRQPYENQQLEIELI